MESQNSKVTTKKWVSGLSEDAGGKPSSKRFISIWGFILMTVAFFGEFFGFSIIRIDFIYVIGIITGAGVLGITMEGIFALYQMWGQGGNWWGGLANITNVFTKKKDNFDDLPRGTFDG